MTELHLPSEFINAQPVLQKIQAAGFEAYFVGGCVRDVLLHQSIHDVDIATSAYPSEIKELFSRTIDIGIEHGTVLVLWHEEQYEVTTFRTESTYQDFRRPDQVTFVRSLAEDLKRRDFTMNALALAENGTIIDLFNGLSDINQKVVRAVGDANERFHEDALRMMRGLRFISQLDFTMAPDTLAAIEKHSQLLSFISIERIRIEWEKLVLGRARNRALRLFLATNCFLYCPQFEQQIEGLQKFIELPEKQLTEVEAAWTLLMDCLDVPERQFVAFFKEWKLSNDTIKQIQKTYQGLQFRKHFPWNRWMVYTLGAEVVLRVESLLAYYNPEQSFVAIEELVQLLPIESLKDLQVNGHDLQHTFQKKPGKWLSDTLHFLEKQVVEGAVANQKVELLQAAENYLAGICEK
ncbi:CCA tRNA nucleotidyltransferase [Enterococcus italicus]|uniref:CCA-adding enzyme n=1 Tax=Enterococcus italicus (strain DSM 15952 / CCUG 50447 / LMG 22039 / TP 1.5) TaxID=888064 RepID=E6LGY7_ENTI1|nr:CCA tRNA nucleotidyltransferase [Enterococcus italicus]EFU73511.1 tRNA nucleotidyltransferase/poly(A) polymerase family protein [Enterococcus italicus DSM 15952]